MSISQLSIARPVLATIMTLAVVLFGVLAFTRLSVRQYPDISVPIVSVRTVYTGASARLVETDVTSVLEEALSGIESVKTFRSVSSEEVSQITLEFELTRDLDGAASDVRDRVTSIRRSLPAGIEEPIISKASADAQAIMWLALFSERYTELELTDYAVRSIKDRLGSIPGVAAVWIWGARQYAMRIWLDADRLSARALTVQDVEAALRGQNVAIPSGRIESDRLEFSVRTHGELQTPEQFNQVVIATRDGYPIRLEDVGFAEIGAEDDRKYVRVNGRPTVGIGIVKQSKANTLAVAAAVKEIYADLVPTIPDGMTLAVASDQSVYIERAIREVYATMAISLGLVVLVIYLFLGSARATLIPAVAIPASIIGACTFMYAFGYSINMLTLLGLVLAIGLVVDDAIVMLENIHRRIEGGQSPMAAAREGSREIGFAVLATTVTLVAVFMPLFFLRGATVRLFAEMAVAVAGSVLLSGFVALTLTPMMSARLLRGHRNVGHECRDPWPRRTLNSLSQRALANYRLALAGVIEARGLALATSLILVIGGAWLYRALPAELAPVEDSGAFMVSMTAPEGATIRYTDHYVRQLEALFATVPEIRTYFTWVATGTRPTRVTRAGTWVTLTDWDDRPRSQQDIVADLAPGIATIPGIQAFPVHPPAFEQAGTKAPVQLILGAASYEELERAAGTMVDRLKAYPGVVNVQNDLELSKPELDVYVHRNKAADLGISIADIGRTLETLLGGRVVTTFTQGGREHPVVVKMADRDRAKPSDIGALYVRSERGALVQLNNVVTVDETGVPTELIHHDRMRAATITAGMASGYTLGEVLSHIEALARESLPLSVRIAYSGEAKEFKQASGALLTTFFLAFLVIYLVLAAQFESFLHPFTILFAVPPAVTGALLTLLILHGTVNVYSEIGLIMLLGLATKNAILIVDVANQLQAEGFDVMSATIEAAVRRARPILMTTLATILGAVPLAMATGAGSAGRRQIGYVIVGGMLVSTILTLFIVPAIHALVAERWSLGSRHTVDSGDRASPAPEPAYAAKHL